MPDPARLPAHAAGPLAADAESGSAAADTAARGTAIDAARAAGDQIAGAPSLLDIPWQRALRLQERVAAPPRAAAGLPTAARTADGFDREKAARRLERWRRQSPFSDPALLARRLEADGLTERRFAELLGESDVPLGDRRPRPGWLEDLAAALAGEAATARDAGSPLDPAPLASGSATAAAALPPAWRSAGAGAGDGDLLAVFAPLVAHAAAALRDAATRVAKGAGAAGDSIVDVDGFCASYGALLAARLRSRISRVLAVELSIDAREGRLAGDSPEERFRSFVRSWTPRRRVELLARYPVLARQLAVCARQWIDFGREVLEHLAADRAGIVATFFDGEDPGVLTGIEGETGDLHRGGRCVVIARFARGHRLVYKPRSLAADHHFQELLAWLDERGAEPPLRTLRLVDRGGHGWEEFVAATPCATVVEVERFYRRIGSYLALLYLVDATDFHLENLIADGEHPMLVDLESLFHGRAQRSFPLQIGAALEHSVLRCGLLPQRRQVGPGAEAPDISGLWGAAGQLSAEPLPHWVDAGTDAMRLARERLRMPGARNRPRLGIGEDTEIDPLDHGAAVLAGLRDTYLLLLAHRDELLAEDGPLAAFAADPVRVILRPTALYAKLLSEGSHPHVLGDALELERHFDRLWVPVVEQPLLAAAIPSEADDLWQGNVPVFTSLPGSRDLWDSRGRLIPEVWDAPSLGVVLERVRRLSPRDLARQSWFVRASLATRVANAHQSRLPHYELDPAAPAAGRAELLAAAREIAARLDLLAGRADGEAGWWGLALQADGWSLVELGWDLYGGLLGIAMFLAYLAELTGEESPRALAEAATVAAVRLLGKEVKEPRSGIGAFDGLGGAIYALCHLGQLWRRPSLIAEAVRLLAPLRGRIADDTSFDLVSGAAGAAAALLVLHRLAPEAGALQAAGLCGERLLAGARRLPEGWGWPKRQDEPPLGGFSHGAAGIALALGRLGAATADERWLAAARQGLRYDRSLFSPELGTWRDLRRLETASGQPAAGEAAPMWAWCHGAPGIGLSRLALRPLLDDPRLDAEIATALASTLERGFGMNHSLCHGDLGNLELPAQAAGSLDGGSGLGQRVERLAAMALAGIRARGWLCGVPEGLETPGLMTGLAGIGYGLLRLADPARVPCVLTMEGPPDAG